MADSLLHRPGEAGEPPDSLGRVEVHPGSGLVLRRRGLLLVVPVVEASVHDVVATMVGICTDRSNDGDHRHIRRLARLVTEDDAHRVPAFACLTAHDDRVLIVAHGAVRVVADDQESDLSPGTQSQSWVERSVAATFSRLSVGSPDVSHHDGPSTLSLDLLDGGVPGAGVTMHLPGIPPSGPVATRASDIGAAAGPSAGMTVLRATPHTHIVSLAPRPADPSRRRAPLPVGRANGAGSGPLEPTRDGAAPVAPSPVHVSGIVCQCGGFTSPDSGECGACGAPLDPDGPRETRARPPLGILITNDGRVFTLTDDMVVGREPDQAPEVKAGHARPLVLRDSEHSTSRVHAQIRLSGWKVDVVDRGSANGTFISRSGSAGPWLPVPPGPGTALAPGDRLRLGKRELLFDRYQAF